MEKRWMQQFPSREGLYLIQRDRLIEAYTAPGRFYHSWEYHIERLLADLHRYQCFVQPGELPTAERAILYHDFFYQIPNTNGISERLSAESCYQATGDALAKSIIEATTHHTCSDPTSTTALVLSLDLLGLADPYEDFKHSGTRILAEYKHAGGTLGVFPKKILQGRIDWLVSFQSRAQIFPHWYFEENFADQARENLHFSADDLSQELRDLDPLLRDPE